MMKRIWMLAGLVTILGATTSEAQYEDSQPPDQYTARYETESTYDPSYDYELLGPPEDRYRGDGYYSEPDIDVGIFASLGYDGRWHMTASYGWVWRPYTRASWRPYTTGRWVWTSHGWTWLSYEPFGWATYHYGYWVHDGFLGWVWIPGYEWSAARVQFAYYDNYVCWTPLPRPGYYHPAPWSTAGVHIWFTIGADRFCDPYPARYYVTPKYKSVYRERIAYKAPERSYVERYTGTPIHKSTVKFKHTSWSKSVPNKNAPGARFQSSKGPSRAATKVLTTKNGRGRQSVVEPRQAMKAPRGATQTRAQKGTVEKSRQAPRPQFSAQANREPNRAAVRQSRPANRSSKALSVSRGNAAERKQMTVNRNRGASKSIAKQRTPSGSGARKSIATQRKSGRSDAAKLRKSTTLKQRGKAKK